jgi:hypothetical protein
VNSLQTGLEGLLLHLLRGLEPGDLATAAQRLAALDIKRLVECCLDDDPTVVLHRMSEESYKHANGFEKISLPGIPGSPVRLRFHIWRPAQDEDGHVPSDAHNHVWPLASRTLAGELTNDLYGADLRPDGDHFHYRHFQAEPKLAHGFAHIGRARLTQRDEIVTGEGETYTLTPQSIHRVSPASDAYTATAVLELAPVRKATDVFTQSAPKPTGVKVFLPRYHPEAIRDKLSELHERC